MAVGLTMISYDGRRISAVIPPPPPAGLTQHAYPDIAKTGRRRPVSGVA